MLNSDPLTIADSLFLSIIYFVMKNKDNDGDLIDPLDFNSIYLHQKVSQGT